MGEPIQPTEWEAGEAKKTTTKQQYWVTKTLVYGRCELGAPHHKGAIGTSARGGYVRYGLDDILGPPKNIGKGRITRYNCAMEGPTGTSGKFGPT